MQGLEEIKAKLDETDEKIIELIDKKRELIKLISKVEYKESTAKFICKEYMDFDIKRVVYQGVEGAYSHIVTKKLFPDEVLNGNAKYCIIPIENSSAGIVSDVYDLLLKKDVVIVAEYDLHISHCLLGIRGAKLGDIRTVYSHPQALMQCGAYLKEHPCWSQISFLNTALSAKKVRDDKDISQAAIASKLSGDLYDLDILDEGINRNVNNTTRFVVLSKEKIFSKKSNKLSLILELPHEKGMLYNILGIFVLNGLNLVKVESRPIPEKTFEYRFFIDIEGNLSLSNVSNVLEILKKEVTFLKILGNYCSVK